MSLLTSLDGWVLQIAGSAALVAILWVVLQIYALLVARRRHHELLAALDDLRKEAKHERP